jgi:hypothetical protein
VIKSLFAFLSGLFAKEKCPKCRGGIKQVCVAHPIRMSRAFPCGGGECNYSMVSYCPWCESKPITPGAPDYYYADLPGAG